VKAIHQISDAISTVQFLSIVFPFSFPIVALIDGAGAAYIGWACVATFLATLALVPVNLALNVASDICEWIATEIQRNRKEREEATRAMHAYLLNGGRA
jgi:hypothetical protein